MAVKVKSVFVDSALSKQKRSNAHKLREIGKCLRLDFHSSPPRVPCPFIFPAISDAPQHPPIRGQNGKNADARCKTAHGQFAGDTSPNDRLALLIRRDRVFRVGRKPGRKRDGAAAISAAVSDVIWARRRPATGRKTSRTRRRRSFATVFPSFTVPRELITTFTRRDHTARSYLPSGGGGSIPPARE